MLSSFIISILSSKTTFALKAASHGPPLSVFIKTRGLYVHSNVHTHKATLLFSFQSWWLWWLVLHVFPFCIYGGKGFAELSGSCSSLLCLTVNTFTPGSLPLHPNELVRVCSRVCMSVSWLAGCTAGVWGAGCGLERQLRQDEPWSHLHLLPVYT